MEALYAAIFAKQNLLLGELLANNAGLAVSQVNDHGYSLLCTACESGNTRAVSFLLAHADIQVNSKTPNGSTPLFLASEAGHIATVRLLLHDSRVDINLTNNEGFSPLSRAAKRERLEIVKLFLACGRDLSLGMLTDAVARVSGTEKQLLIEFVKNPEQVRSELRWEMEITEFLVRQPTPMTRTEYENFVKGLPCDQLDWWIWPGREDWVQKSYYEGTKHAHLLVKDRQSVCNQPAFEKFAFLSQHLGFDPNIAKEVFAVSNEALWGMFEGFCYTNFVRHWNSPDLFDSKDWQMMAHRKWREVVLTSFVTHLSKFQWNTEKRAAVVPMIQGTSEDAAWSICEGGFGTVGKLDDGFYGAGIYFTSNFRYAEKYSTRGSRGRAYVISMVAPGNPFPVVENPSDPVNGYKGKACRRGYQSHYVLVNGQSIADAIPLPLPHSNPEIVVDELVVFERSQSLPMFVFFTD